MWSKLKVGDTVYLKVGNEITECKIEKAGRKYLYIDYPTGFRDDLKFEINDSREYLGNVSRYSASYYLYLSRDTLELEIEQRKLDEKVRRFLRDCMYRKMDIETLRKMSKLIDEVG